MPAVPVQKIFPSICGTWRGCTKAFTSIWSFFAVLTEEGVWKGILGEWEMACELVTLLRELEGGIPKMGVVIPHMPRRVPGHLPQRAMSADAATMPQVPAHLPMQASAPAQTHNAAPVAVERPFDTNGTSQENKLPPLPLHPPVTGQQQSVYEAETPLAYPEDPALPAGHDLQHDQDEPSDFEWRNLKKLTVLVLSSLIWKNKTVQDQVRRYGGLEALVGCCRPDEHNPYIREHAIMCLRFAVEGCEENAKVIRKMAAAQKRQLENSSLTLGSASPASTGSTEDVPKEVLDTNGYETFMDPKGQVGLRRKEAHAHASSSTTPATASTSGASNAGVQKPPRLSSTKLTAERAAELMSSALSSLPLGDKLIDKGKIEALAKLDRAFDMTGSSDKGRRKG